MKKKLVSYLAVVATLFMVSPVFAEAQKEVLSVDVHATYGKYSDSVQRDKIESGTVNLQFAPNIDDSIALAWHTSKLTRKAPLDNIDGTTWAATLTKFFALDNNGYLGGTAKVLYNKSDDTNSDHRTIPYVALAYKTPDRSKYVDIGYAYTEFVSPTINQYTATGGIALFDGWVWSQTRLYYIHLSKEVQGKTNTFAVEERLSYFAIPQTLTLSLYGMLGERIYVFDPDLTTAYTLPDIQTGSAGATVTWNLSKELSIYADGTYEAYNNADINNKYSVLYGTVGVKFSF